MYYQQMHKLEDFIDKKPSDDENYRVVIFFDEMLIDSQGEQLRVEARIKNYNCNLKFKAKAKQLFYPFNSRQQQYIVAKTLKTECSFDYLRKKGVIREHFPLHNTDRENILISWSEYKWRLQAGFLTGKFINNMQPLNVIKDYYGEKIAFHFAWMIHYTAWLIPLSVCAIIYATVTIWYRSVQGETDFQNLLNTEVSIFYCIAVVIWMTLFNASWARKQNAIANEWLVRDFQDDTLETDSFQNEVEIDPDTHLEIRVAKKNVARIVYFVGVLVTLFSVAVVILCQLGLEYANYKLQHSEEVKRHIWLPFLPGTVNVLLIGIFGKIYKWLSFKMAIGENHQYQTDLENSIINKIYMFQFVNTYISNFFCIFYLQDFKELQLTLIIMMVFKQIVFVLAEYYWLKISVRNKMRKVEKLFEERIQSINDGLADDMDKNDQVAMADLRLQKQIELQVCMKAAPETLVYFYSEAVIQLGFISFFAVSFPFAPIFSFFTNLLSLKLKLKIMARYGRRNQAIGSSGIGNWKTIMSVLAFVAVPINLSILLYARNPGNNDIGALQDLDNLELEQESAFTQYLLTKRGSFWTRFNTLTFFIVMEHLLIGLQAILQKLIPQVPQAVKEAESKRKTLQRNALKEYNSLHGGVGAKKNNRDRSRSSRAIDRNIQNLQLETEQQQENI